MAEFQVTVAQAALSYNLTVGEAMASLASMLLWDAERYVLSGEVATETMEGCDCDGYHEPDCPRRGSAE
jgi:hypothetical protein